MIERLQNLVVVIWKGPFSGVKSIGSRLGREIRVFFRDVAAVLRTGWRASAGRVGRWASLRLLSRRLENRQVRGPQVLRNTLSALESRPGLWEAGRLQEWLRRLRAGRQRLASVVGRLKTRLGQLRAWLTHIEQRVSHELKSRLSIDVLVLMGVSLIFGFFLGVVFQIAVVAPWVNSRAVSRSASAAAPEAIHTPVTPASAGELLIVVAAFPREDGRRGERSIDASAELVDQLKQAFSQVAGLPRSVRIARTPEGVKTSEQAWEISRETGAALVIWGLEAEGGWVANYEVTRGASPDYFWVFEEPARPVMIGVERVDPVSVPVEWPAADADGTTPDVGLAPYLSTLAIAQISYLGQKYETAISLFDQVLEQGAKGEMYAEARATLLYDRGLAYDHLGQYRQAVADYGQAIDLNMHLTEAYNNRGVVYYRLGERDQALIDFTAATVVDAAFAVAYSNRGAVYAELNNLGVAQDDLTRAVKLNPGLVPAYYNRGLVRKVLGQAGGAIGDFQRVVETSDNVALQDSAQELIEEILSGLSSG